MKITESQLRRIIREELLRESASGIPGEVKRNEFFARVEELAREMPDAAPKAIVEDALQDFAERDGVGGGLPGAQAFTIPEKAEKLVNHLRNGAPLNELEPGDEFKLPRGGTGVVEKWHGIANILYFLDNNGKRLWIGLRPGEALPTVELISRGQLVAPEISGKATEYKMKPRR